MQVVGVLQAAGAGTLPQEATLWEVTEQEPHPETCGKCRLISVVYFEDKAVQEAAMRPVSRARGQAQDR